MEEQLEQASPEVEAAKTEEANPMSFEDGVIKVNLNDLNKPQEESVPEAQLEPEAIVNETVETEEVAETPKPPVQELQQEPESYIEEVTNEEVQEVAEELEEQVEQALVEAEAGIELPENIQKVVEFMNETGGSLEDYVKLNTDYSSLNEDQLLREYYESTRPHLDKEDIDFLMEDNFSFDEDIDEERDIRRKKISKREELSKAKNHLDGLKTRYYDEIKAGSKLNPEQVKAVEFFNRYKQENEEATKVAESQLSTFKNKTESLFSNDFKGFDFNVGEKKFRFKVNNVDQVKDTQSDINNLVKKFLNDKNEMNDAAGYHKSLFTAMNADKIANHFYEQGKSDAMKSSMQKAKNIDMNPRGAHENVKPPNGWTVKSIKTGSSSKFGIKTRK
tara:strand:- start:119 stop:1288 length:1170 start_codon:yes stop_codon:yes gene_type:complete